MANEKDLIAESGDALQEDRLVIDQQFINDIRELITESNTPSLKNIIADLHDIEIAEIIDHLPPEDGIYIFRLLDDDVASLVLTEIRTDLKVSILESLGRIEINNIIAEMDSDDTADVIQDLPEELQTSILEAISEEDQVEVRELLKYDEDTAGGIMATEFISVHESSTIYDATMEIKKQAEEVADVYDVFVVDESNVIVGTIDLKTLIITGSYKKVEEVMNREFISVLVNVDQEEVARTMEKHDLVSVPVVNSYNQLLGQITFDDIIDVIREEAEEDIQRLTGVVEEEFSDKTSKIIAARLPWLLVGLFGELIAGMVIRSFESTLAQMLVLTSYIPLIMAMGGSTGVQSTSIVIQALARGDLWVTDVKKRLLKEINVAFVIALVCSVIIFFASYVRLGNVTLSLTIGSALIFVMINASILGTLVPIILKNFKVDPAVATGPFITTLNDILGLTIYFTIAYLVFFW